MKTPKQVTLKLDKIEREGLEAARKELKLLTPEEALREALHSYLFNEWGPSEEMPDEDRLKDLPGRKPKGYKGLLA